MKRAGVEIERLGVIRVLFQLQAHVVIYSVAVACCTYSCMALHRIEVGTEVDEARSDNKQGWRKKGFVRRTVANLLNSNGNLRSKGQGTKKENSYQHHAWARSLLLGSSVGWWDHVGRVRPASAALF